MKRAVLTYLAVALTASAAAQWQAAGDRIKTVWAEQIDPANVLPEYPRPLMERAEWKNLNGLWNYSVVPVGKPVPDSFDGQILVPFAIESSLSGFQKPAGSGEELRSHPKFTVPASWKGRDILLHFGAVDWKAEIYLNDIKIGSHSGGYTPFSFNITPFLNGREQTLAVKVWDPTDGYFQPRGKQVSKPANIVYTAVSGIWQTVWIEPVAKSHISSLTITPDIDKGTVFVHAGTLGTSAGDYLEITLSEGKRTVSTAKTVVAETVEIPVPDAKLWSPDNPFLYDLEIKLFSGGRVSDRVASYCAMRKISAAPDKNGVMRLRLNNNQLFHLGLLDQGWWPDGLYTAPTDQALASDIAKAKDLGFNMLRKHIKVESARWYFHCDRIGMLVWQDMPSGGPSPQWQMREYFNGTEVVRSAVSEANYRKEWKEIIDCLYSYPSIGVWVPFNEAWGQFKTVEIAAWTKEYDPTRLVNPASGGNHYVCGDMLDLHHYPEPNLYLYDPVRPTVLGEYGGIGLALKGHLWLPDKNWGYVQYNTPEEVTNEYQNYANQLLELIKKGFSAAVYTQITDVEGEVNGLITYDRKVIKVDEVKVKTINRQICNSLSEQTVDIY